MKCKEVGTTRSVEDIAFALGWGRGEGGTLLLRLYTYEALPIAITYNIM